MADLCQPPPGDVLLDAQKLAFTSHVHHRRFSLQVGQSELQLPEQEDPDAAVDSRVKDTHLLETGSSYSASVQQIFQSGGLEDFHNVDQRDTQGAVAYSSSSKESWHV